MTHLLAIDIEASGPNVLTHRMIAFGAVVVSIAQEDIPEPRAEHEFVRVLDAVHEPTDEPTWDARCVEEFWMNQPSDDDEMTPLNRVRALADTVGVVSEKEAMCAFVEWAHRMFELYPSLVVVVDTAAFDTTWMNVALARHTDVPALLYLRPSGKYRSVRDTTSYVAGVAHHPLDEGKTGDAVLRVLRARAWPVAATDTAHDHNPLNDARTIGLQATFVLNKMWRIQVFEWIFGVVVWIVVAYVGNALLE